MRWVKPIGAVLYALSASAAAAGNLLALTNPALIAEERTVFFSATTFVGSDFSPVRKVRYSDLRDDYAPRAGRNLALFAARMETGVESQGFRIGTVYRQEWFGVAQRETLDLYRAERLSLNHAVGASYPIDYRLDGFEVRGLQFGKALRLSIDPGWSLKLGASGSLLQGRRLREEQWSGSALATAARSVAITGDFTRTFSGINVVSNQFVAAYKDGIPAGHGYGLDVGMRLEREDGARLDWTAADIASSMHWSDIPQITLSGSSVYNGTFPTGKKWRVNVDERLPIKQALALSVPVQKAHLELSDSVMRGNHFPGIGLRKEYPSGWSAGLDYDFRFRSVGIDLAHGAFRFGIRSDTLLLARARAFALDLGFKIGF